MKEKKFLLKDIARKLDVSVTTVSFVLNGKGKEKKIPIRSLKEFRIM